MGLPDTTELAELLNVPLREREIDFDTEAAALVLRLIAPVGDTLRLDVTRADPDDVMLALKVEAFLVILAEVVRLADPTSLVPLTEVVKEGVMDVEECADIEGEACVALTVRVGVAVAAEGEEVGVELTPCDTDFEIEIDVVIEEDGEGEGG